MEGEPRDMNNPRITKDCYHLDSAGDVKRCRWIARSLAAVAVITILVVTGRAEYDCGEPRPTAPTPPWTPSGWTSCNMPAPLPLTGSKMGAYTINWQDEEPGDQPKCSCSPGASAQGVFDFNTPSFTDYPATCISRTKSCSMSAVKAHFKKEFVTVTINGQSVEPEAEFSAGSGTQVGLTLIVSACDANPESQEVTFSGVEGQVSTVYEKEYNNYETYHELCGDFSWVSSCDPNEQIYIAYAMCMSEGCSLPGCDYFRHFSFIGDLDSVDVGAFGRYTLVPTPLCDEARKARQPDGNYSCRN
jgi:hypothetical protein